MSLPILIFAAGRGTRMGALAANTPKPMLFAGGKRLIDHALDLATSAGMAPILVNTHQHADQLHSHLAARTDVQIQHEETLLETGGGLKRARQTLGPGPVATLNADAVWKGKNPLHQLLAAFDPNRMDALLLLAPTAQALASGPGDFSLDHGQLRRRAGAPSAPYIYSGAQIINPARLDEIPDTVFSMNILWDMLIAQNRAFGLPMQGGWRDVGTPDALAAAESWLAT